MRRLSLRVNQVLLVLGTALPLIGLAVWLSLSLLQHNQDTLAEGAINRQRAFMSAIDAELRGGIASLQALAASERLEVNDLAGFHREAARFVQFQPRFLNVRLALPDGKIVVNTRQPYGYVYPPASDRESFNEVLTSKQPVISGLIRGQVSGQYIVNLRIPIVRKGQIAYVMSAGISPGIFESLIDQQQLEPGWIIGLTDMKGKIIARRPAVDYGAIASPDFLKAIGRASEGWYRGTTMDGHDTFTAHVTSDFSHWSVGLAIPTEQVYASATHVAWLMGTGLLVSLAIAFVFAYSMSRRISAPVGALARAARSLGSDRAPPLPTESSIIEVADLANALKEAGVAVRERRELLEREKSALQASDRAKDEFLAMLSHELRNPLGVLTTSVHLLRAGKPGDALFAKTQAVIERQLKQMTRLIEDLLDISRVTMGKASLKREVFDLAELVGRVVAAWRTAANRAERKVVLHAKQVWVNADRARVEQILSNLLDNAQKFSPAHAPIEVTVGEHANEAVLTVTDKGEGIEPHMLERVFGLFVQGAQGPDRGRGGMGVGLALVRRLTEMHEGGVSAASDGAGQGATFTVQLPSVAAPTQAQVVPIAPGHAAAKRILLIEDNADARDTLQMLLTLDGHDVAVAADGMAGIAKFSETDPDVVFVDIGLPDISGYEVARRLRTLQGRRGTLLAAMTGYGQEQDERRALNAGFNLHLVKPVTIDQLREVIASLDDVPPQNLVRADRTASSRD